ncbi:hypothetical protein JHK85_018325 [Glycine max]|nr:hypothetical protein JHK85_018325 [Glycine max]
MNHQILQAQDDIEDLNKQLKESKVERRHKEECEAIRKLIAMQPRGKDGSVIKRMTAESGAQIRILPKDKASHALIFKGLEKLIADINTAATNNGYDDSILKPFQEAKGVCTKKNTKLAASSVSTDVSSSHDDVGPKLAKELSNKDG